MTQCTNALFLSLVHSWNSELERSDMLNFFLLGSVLFLLLIFATPVTAPVALLLYWKWQKNCWRRPWCSDYWCWNIRNQYWQKNDIDTQGVRHWCWWHLVLEQVPQLLLWRCGQDIQLLLALQSCQDKEVSWRGWIACKLLIIQGSFSNNSFKWVHCWCCFYPQHHGSY